MEWHRLNRRRFDLHTIDSVLKHAIFDLASVVHEG